MAQIVVYHIELNIRCKDYVDIIEIFVLNDILFCVRHELVLLRWDGLRRKFLLFGLFLFLLVELFLFLLLGLFLFLLSWALDPSSVLV